MGAVNRTGRRAGLAREAVRKVWASLRGNLVWTLAVAIALTSVSAATHPAAAVACSGDTWADYTSWYDNYWVGYNTAGTTSCDLNGRYTVGVQMINWGKGYRQSGVDGYYGANTHQDVRSFQAFYGLTVDGLVGSNTWLKYQARKYYSHDDGSFDVYGITGYGNSKLAYDTVAAKWYIAWPTWKTFGTAGP